MGNWIRNKLVWSIVGSVGVYAALVPLIEYKYLSLFMNIFLVIISSAVITIYTPAMIRAVNHRRIIKEDLLLVGVVLAWIGLGATRVIGVYNTLEYYDNSNNPIIRNPLFGLFLAIACVAGTMHVLAPGYDGVATHRYWVLLAMVIGAAAAVVGVVFDLLGVI